ncbi:hypothetical protein QQ045_007782 [Rhodiola kirilowii]
MEHNRPSGRTQRAPSPRSKSSSTSPRVSLPEPKPSHPLLVQRSKSPRTVPLSQRSPSHYSISSGVNGNKANKAVSTSSSWSGSQSAWALSPGRSLAPPTLDQLNSRKKTVVVTSKTKSSRGGVSGVLKYFKSKKAGPMAEQEYHDFRMLHNRLVQWRFTNAKAEAALASVKVQAENKLFSVWLQILKVRNMIMEKRIWMQKNQHRTKLLDIVNPQMGLLEEWMRIEKRNFEALSKLTRKLCAISVRLPLVYGAKVKKHLQMHF